MLNKKNIFTVLLACILVFASIFTVSNFKILNNNMYNINYAKRQLDYDHLVYLYNIIDEYDNDYEMITFSDNVSKETQEFVRTYFRKSINEAFSYMDSDLNISYLIKKTNANYVIKSKGDIKTNDLKDENSLIYSSVSISNTGSITCEGDFCEQYQSYNIHEFLDNFYINIVYPSDNNPSILLNNEYIHLEDIHLNIPAGYTLYFMVPNEIIPEGVIYNYLDTYESIAFYIAITLVITLVILFIFFIICPISVTEMIQPYHTIKNWLFEFNILFFGTLIVLLFIGTLYLTKFTVQDTINYWLNQVSLHLNDGMLTFVNFIVWLCLYILVSIIPFLFKYMLTYGIFKYFMNYTILGILCSKFKNFIQEMMSINVKDSLILQLISMVFINGIIVFFLINILAYTPGEFKLLASVLYSLGLFIPSLIYISKTYQQYQLLLDKTKLLSEGHFNIQIDENVGMFNEYKNELMHVKDGFEKAVQEEIKATSMRTELITNVSHDLKTPLTCIKNYVTLLEDESLEEDKKKEYVQYLNQYTNRLTRLVEDLFEVSKVTSGNVSLDLVELDLVDLVKQVLTENEDILSKNHLNIISKFVDNHISVSLDSNKTYRIFENLIVNISKYALPHSRVYVEVKETENEAIVEFKNISKDEMTFTPEAITERFVRGDSSRHENGSGLGLAIVKSYSELQNIDFKITIDGDLFKTTLTFKK